MPYRRAGLREVTASLRNCLPADGVVNQRMFRGNPSRAYDYVILPAIILPDSTLRPNNAGNNDNVLVVREDPCPGPVVAILRGTFLLVRH